MLRGISRLSAETKLRDGRRTRRAGRASEIEGDAEGLGGLPSGGHGHGHGHEPRNTEHGTRNAEHEPSKEQEATGRRRRNDFHRLTCPSALWSSTRESAGCSHSSLAGKHTLAARCGGLPAARRSPSAKECQTDAQRRGRAAVAPILTARGTSSAWRGPWAVDRDRDRDGDRDRVLLIAFSVAFVCAAKCRRAQFRFCTLSGLPRVRQ